MSSTAFLCVVRMFFPYLCRLFISHFQNMSECQCEFLFVCSLRWHFKIRSRLHDLYFQEMTWKIPVQFRLLVWWLRELYCLLVRRFRVHLRLGQLAGGCSKVTSFLTQDLFQLCMELLLLLLYTTQMFLWGRKYNVFIIFKNRQLSGKYKTSGLYHWSFLIKLVFWNLGTFS